MQKDASGNVSWPEWKEDEEEFDCFDPSTPTIHSVEGNAQITIESHPPGGQPLFRAQYLAEVPADDPVSARYSAPKDRQTKSYFSWVDQFFTLEDISPPFIWPTAMLMKSRHVDASHKGGNLPVSLPLEVPAVWSNLESGEGLIAYDLVEMCRNPHSFPNNREYSESPVVVVEDNEDGLFRALFDTEGRPVVDVWVHQDGSYFRLEGSFLHYFHVGGDKVYHIEAIKHITIELEDGTRYVQSNHLTFVGCVKVTFAYSSLFAGTIWVVLPNMLTAS